MFIPTLPKEFDPSYQKGKAEGFAIAESYLKDIAKDFYKQMKKGLLTRKATMTTLTTHKCNCEYCDLDVK